MCSSTIQGLKGWALTHSPIPTSLRIYLASIQQSPYRVLSALQSESRYLYSTISMTLRWLARQCCKCSVPQASSFPNTQPNTLELPNYSEIVTSRNGVTRASTTRVIYISNGHQDVWVLHLIASVCSVSPMASGHKLCLVWARDLYGRVSYPYRGLGTRPCHRDLGTRPCRRGLGMRPCRRGLGTRPCRRGLGTRPCCRDLGMRPCHRGLGTRLCHRGLGTRPCCRGLGMKLVGKREGATCSCGKVTRVWL